MQLCYFSTQLLDSVLLIFCGCHHSVSAQAHLLQFFGFGLKILHCHSSLKATGDVNCPCNKAGILAYELIGIATPCLLE